MFYLNKSYKFEAGHQLPHHQGKCKNAHGHSYTMELHLKSPYVQESGPESGMVMDFDEINHIVKPIIAQYLDHHWLNTSLKLENPTAELIAKWVFNKLHPQIPLLYAVTIQETASCRARYEP